jgi:hypothetical protein
MDNIWKNAAKKQRARDLREATAKSTLKAPVQTTDTTTLHQKPVTATTAPHWCDPETVTLEQIDKHSRRLLQDWPKEDGIPFPREILETLRDIKLKVLARDAKKRHSATDPVDNNTDTASTIHTLAPVCLVTDPVKPITPVPDPQDSISTTTNNPVYPTTATTDLWRKVARKAAKIAYQHEYYGTIL